MIHSDVVDLFLLRRSVFFLYVECESTLERFICFDEWIAANPDPIFSPSKIIYAQQQPLEGKQCRFETGFMITTAFT